MENGCHAPFSTIRKFLRDVIGVTVSRGYLAKLIQNVSQALAPFYEELLVCLPLETTLNVDETGHKKSGNLFWTWVFKAELYRLFRLDKSRGSQVLIELLGREFESTLGCDYFSAYRKYMQDFNVAVQFCIAHLIRDVKFLTQLPDEPTQAYGNKLLSALKTMFKHEPVYTIFFLVCSVLFFWKDELSEYLRRMPRSPRSWISTKTTYTPWPLSYEREWSSASPRRSFTMEGFWFLLRSWLRPHRGIFQEHLPLYLGFFEFFTMLKTRGKGLGRPA